MLSEARNAQAPVFRELYSEKRVVAEERRARIDNAPMGRFQVGLQGRCPFHRLAHVVQCLQAWCACICSHSQCQPLYTPELS